MNEFTDTIKSYYSLERLYMNKNERIEIKSLQNGYLVERSWRERTDSTDSLGWNYVDEQFVFLTWDEVVKYVTDNKLDVPPAKI